MRRTAKLASAMLLIGSSAAAFGAELNLKLQIPRLDVAEYHRPYVAVWVENQDQGTAAQLAVWYQTDSKKEDGTQWLKDLRNGGVAAAANSKCRSTVSRAQPAPPVSTR